MTYEETKEILTVLKTNYPQSFRNMENDESHRFLALWAEAFKDDDVSVVVNAVKAIIYGDTREFAPNIGQVKEKIYQLSNPIKLDADEAWNLVSKALRNSIYNSAAEFEKLPDEVKAGVGSQRQLKEWAMMDASTVNSVVASVFKKGYRGRVEARKEYDKLPSEAKLMIEGLTENMKMIE